MRKCAKFEKVSLNQFKEDFCGVFNINENELENIYNDIKLPKRATVSSAGYDFYLPVDLELKPGETIKIPTGIRCYMEEDIVLSLYPRSSLGFKFKMQLNNTVGIIDADYVNSDNQGHIFVRMTNESDKQLVVEKGTAFAQGIFTQYLLTEDDDVTEIRNGGLGSTTK